MLLGNFDNQRRARVITDHQLQPAYNCDLELQPQVHLMVSILFLFTLFFGNTVGQPDT